jgi:hypothetical protein
MGTVQKNKCKKVKTTATRYNVSQRADSPLPWCSYITVDSTTAALQVLAHIGSFPNKMHFKTTFSRLQEMSGIL